MKKMIIALVAMVMMAMSTNAHHGSAVGQQINSLVYTYIINVASLPHRDYAGEILLSQELFVNLQR